MPIYKIIKLCIHAATVWVLILWNQVSLNIFSTFGRINMELSSCLFRKKITRPIVKLCKDRVHSFRRIYAEVSSCLHHVCCTFLGYRYYCYIKIKDTMLHNSRIGTQILLLNIIRECF